MSGNELVYTIEELAQVLGVSAQTVYKAMKAGQIPVQPVRIGRRYLFPKQAVLDWLAGARAVPSDPRRGVGQPPVAGSDQSVTKSRRLPKAKPKANAVTDAVAASA